MPGVVEYFMQVAGEKGIHTCHFDKGAVSGTGFTAASFTTSNAEVQSLIEKRDLFLKGRIQIAAVYEEPKEEVDNTTAESGVTTLQEARKYLLEKGATMEELQNKAAVLEKAKELNISFPNWK